MFHGVHGIFHVFHLCFHELHQFLYEKLMKFRENRWKHGSAVKTMEELIKIMENRWKPWRKDKNLRNRWKFSKSMKSVEKETIFTNEKWRTAASRPKIQKHLILVKAIIPHPYLTRMPRFDTKKYSTNACRIALKPLIAYQVEGWFHQGTEQNIWSVFSN